MTDDPRNLVLEIKRLIRGIGPGFLVRVAAKPGEWQSLLDCIPGPVDVHPVAQSWQPSREEFEIVREASRLFQQASETWMTRALKAEAALSALNTTEGSPAVASEPETITDTDKQTAKEILDELATEEDPYETPERIMSTWVRKIRVDATRKAHATGRGGK